MDLPALPLPEWEDSRLYWQLVCQIVGKTRLKLHPPINHWWHVPLYVSARGHTTGGIPYDGDELEIEVDVHDAMVQIRRGARTANVPAFTRPLCDFYRDYRQALADLDVKVKLVATPYQCKSTIPFAEDRRTGADLTRIQAAHSVLPSIEKGMKEFRGRFIGKCSPVHMFWHSFDLACTRFSGRAAPPMPEADLATREAYSHEVISAGFWYGDDTLPKAAFYCYAAPLPPGIEKRRLEPAEAEWAMVRNSPMALLRYERWRVMPDREDALLRFLQSSYEAGADLAGWDRKALER